jgi:hypothetical protein
MGDTTAPSDHAAFDRAAATILGGMITLIAVLGFVLVETSVGSSPDQRPVAASASGGSVIP